MKWPCLILFCLFLLLGAAPPQQGGDQEKEEMLWTDYAEALDAAQEKKTPIIIYFPVEGQVKDHGVFLKKPMGILSHENPCVKIAYSPDDPLREALRIEANVATVVITDWFGNEVHRLSLKKPTGDFKMKLIEGTLEKVPAIMREINKKLRKQVKKGQGELKRKRYRSAIEIFRKVIAYKGYDATHEAKVGLEEVFFKGEILVAEALTLADESPKKAREKLQQIIKDFQDTRVEDAAWDALEKIPEPEGK